MQNDNVKFKNNFTEVKIVKELLRKYKIKLDKKFGQNFLVDRNVLDKIIEVAELKKADKVIEIGAGIGVLTKELADRVGEVWSWEIDEILGKIAKENLKERENCHLVIGDFLRDKIPIIEKFIVVANLPYQITTPIVRRFLEGSERPERMILLVQKEVAERLSAKPGSAKRGWVTVLVEMFGEVKVEKVIPRTAFFPSPKVESAILVIKNIFEPTFDWKDVMIVVKAGFSSKRKQLTNAVAGGLGINLEMAREMVRQSGIDSKSRAEDLNISEWRKLAEIFKERNG